MSSEPHESLTHPRLERACVRRALVLSMICAALQPAGAQGTDLPVGARVRVDVGTLVTGTFLGVRNDTLLIAGDRDRDTSRVALRAVSELDISRVRPGHALKGAALGLALGAISGVALLTAAGSPRADGPFAGSGSAQAIGALGVGALVGAAIGAAVGSQLRSDHWEPVVYPRFGRAQGPSATSARMGVRYGAGRGRLPQ